MPSPSVLAAVLVEAALKSVFDGFSASCTEASPRPITNFVLPPAPAPLAMSSSTGKPFTRAEIAASVPGIEIDCTEPPVFSSAAPSFATAAFDSEGFFESSTIPPRRLTIPLPLANNPAELIQLRKSCCDWAPGALSADSGARTPSSRPFTSKPPAELSSALAPAPDEEELPSEVITEARPWSACTSPEKVAPASPSPAASHDSPGSSPNAWAPAAAEPVKPPPPGAREEAERVLRLSTSSAIELEEGTSERFTVRVPPSSPTRPPRPCAPAPVADEALLDALEPATVGIEKTCASVPAGALATSRE